MGVVLDPPPGINKSCPLAPSVCMCVDRISWPSLPRVSTAAPAPSPQRIHVERSVQLRVRDMTSDATTRTFLYVLFFKYCSATFKPKIKPEQAAVTSNVTARGASSLACSQLAAEGQHVSGVIVATMIRSMSSTPMPAISRALSDAW